MLLWYKQKGENVYLHLLIIDIKKLEGSTGNFNDNGYLEVCLEQGRQELGWETISLDSYF